MSSLIDRCRSEVKDENVTGKRVCHLTCNECFYPENWSVCNECDLGPCKMAIEQAKRKYPEQYKTVSRSPVLTGEETLYHTLSVVNAHQRIINRVGRDAYLKWLKEKHI